MKSRSLLERVGGLSGRWATALPQISAIVITVLGAGIAIEGLGACFLIGV